MNLLRRAQNWLEQKASSRSYNESTLKQSNMWAISITWGLIATTGLSIFWLILAKTEEIVVAPGTLVPIGSVQDIQMPIGGIVDEILVKDGDRVEANQLLIRLDTESTAQRLKSANENLKLKKRQLELKRLESEQYSSLNAASINTLSQRLVFENKLLERFQALAEVGAVTELQHLQQQNKVRETEGLIRETQIDGLRRQAILQQDTQRLKSEISTLRSDLAESKVTLRYQVLRSPVDGLVFDVQPKGRGFTGRGSETLMKIVPFNALEAKIEIPSSDIGFVKEGMLADISIDSFPASDFGVVEGRVTQLGSDALPPDPSTQQMVYRYPAKIALERQTLKLKTGTELVLQPGMSLNANIKLRKVSYLQLILGSFKDKAESLRQL